MTLDAVSGNIAFPERIFWVHHHLVTAQERVRSETDASVSARRVSLL